MIHRHCSHAVLGLAIAAMILSSVCPPAVRAVDEAEVEKSAGVQVADWLVLGPVVCPLPAFNEEGKPKIGAKELLGFAHVPGAKLKPARDKQLSVAGGGEAIWRKMAADTLGVALSPEKAVPAVAYLATFIETPRWMKIDVEARCSQPFEITIDGKSVVKRDKPGKMDGEGSAKKGSSKLDKGKHTLIVKTVCVPGDTLPDWLFDLSVSAGKGFDDTPVLSLDPARSMNIEDILVGPSMRDVFVSPDGELFAVSMSERTRPEGKSESWLEVRRFKDGSVVKTFRDLDGVSRWQWLPAGTKLSYVSTKDEVSTVRVVDLETGLADNVLEKVKDFSGYSWSPDGTFIIYSITEEPEKNKTGVQRLRNVSDRRRGERDRTSLYLASVPGGMTRRVTAGEHSTYVYDIHPDCKTAVIGRTYEYLDRRPYSKTELVLLDLEDQSTELLWEGAWLGRVMWSPDGEKLLIMASPSEFGGVGLNVPEGTIPNDYDTQAYLFDPETKTAEPLTKEFDPAIMSAFWPKSSKDIFFVAEVGEYSKFYRYNVKKKTFTEVEIDCDVIHRRDVASDKPAAIVTGSGASHAARLYAIDLDKGKSRMLLDPTAERFEHIRLGEVEDWNFDSNSGKTIVGRIHYPPDFNPERKWPCIVYYYGGTSPVGRSFGGRYPKNLWAANGYVVYVLQPSGATGFGQEFSARHVNDWGKTTAGEIIEGTEKFLAAHEFVDPERVGCIGASFGGFMTQLLVTRTDIFAAAVSHAGISSISSYWGEGYWGYGYNAVSAANSFPWNRPDIYIDQSPLFAADKVSTPLLLLHGTSDTNVPPGESEQMYTALKLLGKEVEYIRIEGQNHFVLDFKKRIAWSNAIIGWFDKWLKTEPEWWDDMYPPLDDDEAEEPEDTGTP